ncbi:hypothetical protein J3458_007265 [Metarhizium acridum]|uniref:uncharacterized protein n=1 Tax=Metarhizium acridum TaxID=92637 RepID=UPI001C6C3F7B|nr:hypothetical protein J3458_007265 [Metarhizium acridum]
MLGVAYARDEVGSERVPWWGLLGSVNLGFGASGCQRLTGNQKLYYIVMQCVEVCLLTLVLFLVIHRDQDRDQDMAAWPHGCTAAVAAMAERRMIEPTWTCWLKGYA